MIYQAQTRYPLQILENMIEAFCIKSSTINTSSLLNLNHFL